MKGVRNFFHFWILLFMMLFIGLLFFKLIGYDYFIMPKTGVHTIIPKNTLIITKSKDFDKIKEDNIVLFSKEGLESNLSFDDYNNISIARVLKNDIENNKLIISIDDLKLNSMNIDYNDYINSIIIYIHDIDFFIGILDFFKLQLMLFPTICFFMIVLCDAFIIKHKNDEELDFECDEIINKIIVDNNEHYDNISHLNLTS